MSLFAMCRRWMNVGCSVLFLFYRSGPVVQVFDDDGRTVRVLYAGKYTVYTRTDAAEPQITKRVQDLPVEQWPAVLRRDFGLNWHDQDGTHSVRGHRVEVPTPSSGPRVHVPWVMLTSTTLVASAALLFAILTRVRARS